MRFLDCFQRQHNEEEKFSGGFAASGSCQVESGFPSTLSYDNATDIYESITGFNPVSLNYDSIITSLDDLNRYKSSKFRIPSEIEWHIIGPEYVKDLFKDANDIEVNIGFLWAAFLKRADLVGVFLELGADLR
ncbi:hypothetical protein HUJ04_010508 [Dendroctonus ponderosae]|nr:hypothetical protein HUJ04_010508 [Dendroctonus ponderosae]